MNSERFIMNGNTNFAKKQEHWESLGDNVFVLNFLYTSLLLNQLNFIYVDDHG